MIDDEIRRQTREHRFVLRQRVAVELKVDVPAERCNARRHVRECVPRQHAARQHHEAHAANARIVQTLQFVIADIRRDHRDAARAVAQLRDGRERAAIVEATPGRLHDDRARKAQRALHVPIRRCGRGRRRERRGLGERIACFVDVNVAVASAFEFHRACSCTSKPARRNACAAFTAPAGTRPSNSACVCATVSID